MLRLSKTQNCSYIKIESDILSDFISTPENYTSFTVSAKLNCCNDTTYSQNVIGDQITLSEWNINFPTTITSYINGIWFENIYNNTSFNVLSSPLLVGNYSCSIGTITALFPIVEAYFLANFNIVITQSYTYDSVTGECVYTISGLPTSIKPKYFEIETSSITTYSYFSFLPITNGLFDGGSLLLSPEFFSQGNAFQDGVYSITLNYINSEGNIITENNCFFLDCNTACTVSTKIKELQEASNEKNATNIFLLHYTLTEGSNCGCNCEELCEIFRKLCTNLNSSSCLCGCV